MKKSLIASSVAMALGVSGTASALTVSITNMNFNGVFAASGTLSSDGTGSFQSIDPFYGFHWTADSQAYFGSTGAQTWSGSSAQGAYTYNFTLTGNQVAWGTYFDWNTNLDIAVLNIMDCGGGTAGETCTGIGTPMANGPFKGSAPAFNGSVVSTSVSAVPVPAAAWLMGSGLVGLAGVGRRRKSKKA